MKLENLLWLLAGIAIGGAVAIETQMVALNWDAIISWID